MLVKSIGINLDSVADRHQLLKALNQDVFPSLQRDRGLLNVTVLDFEESGLMSILSFDDALIDDDLNLSEIFRRGATFRGLELEEERFIERHHPVIA